ncbi:MAG: hypothetical protein MI864_15850 [Pseudomonadales bacterium]|nr:hypothetical protein [Pseudomonadales bacterium]
MQTQDYIVDDQGNFRFTKVGLDNQATLLAKAGIDARSIKTYAEYIQARQAAGRYFLEYLQEETNKLMEGKPDTLEWQAIRSIAFGSPEEQDRLLKKLKRKQNIKLV